MLPGGWSDRAGSTPAARPMRDDQLTRRMRGWNRAWGIISRTYGDAACEHDGHVWQYLGTDGGVHIFGHPMFGGRGRLVVHVPVLPEDYEGSSR